MPQTLEAAEVTLKMEPLMLCSDLRRIHKSGRRKYAKNQKGGRSFLKVFVIISDV